MPEAAEAMMLNHRIFRRSMSGLVFIMALTACADPLTSPAASAAERARYESLVVPLEDLMTRVAPSLGEGHAFDDLKKSLSDLRWSLSNGRSADVGHALDRAKSALMAIEIDINADSDVDVIAHTLSAVEKATRTP